MNQEIKQLWIAALRSGEYQQGRGQLRYKNQFCCLGVLCDVYAQETGNADKWRGGQREWFELSVADSEMSMLPVGVQAWAGLTVDDPLLGEARCTELNDGLNGQYKHDFATIADLIEKYL